MQPTKPTISPRQSVTLTISCKIHSRSSPTLSSQPSHTTAEDRWLQLPALLLCFQLCSGRFRNAMLHLVTGLISPQEQWHSSSMQWEATLSAGGRGKEGFRSNSLPRKFTCTPNAVKLAVAGSCRAFCAEEHPPVVYYAFETSVALWCLKSFTGKWLKRKEFIGRKTLNNL